MNRTTLLFLISFLNTTLLAGLPEWQSQYATGYGKLHPHAYVLPVDNEQDYRMAAYIQSPWYQSLNGTWKFNWVRNPENRPKDFYKPRYHAGNWANIKVPGNWERQGFGLPIYVNETYEFVDPMFGMTKPTPPLVPTEFNEVGSYRRTFTVPADWQNRRVVISFEGVSSFFYVWLNGQLLGYNQDSKTSAEFQFSASSYSDANLDKATHINQMEDAGFNYIHLDAQQAGVGTATCGPGVLPHYRVKPLPTYFDFQLTVKSAK